MTEQPRAADAIAATLAEIQERLQRIEAELRELKDQSCEDRRESQQ